MPYWFIAAAAVSAASSIFGGMSSARAARQEAERAQQVANYNAAMQREWGRQQANAIAAASIFNIQMATILNNFNKAQTAKISEYNASLVKDVSEYNAKLYEYKVSEVYDALELDQLLVHEEAQKQQGSAIAQYAASGVILTEGSPEAVLIDMRTQEELTKAILEFNADTTAKEMLNAAARSRWEGEAEARKILFEGRMSTIAMDINTAAQISMQAADASFQIVNTQNSAYMRSVEILYGGAQQSNAMNYDASRYMLNGFMSAAQTVGDAAMSYGKYIKPNPSPSYSSYGPYASGYKFPKANTGSTPGTSMISLMEGY